MTLLPETERAVCGPSVRVAWDNTLARSRPLRALQVDTYSRLLPQKAFWTLYCKGDPAAPLDGPSHVVHLPNVGREVGTVRSHSDGTLLAAAGEMQEARAPPLPFQLDCPASLWPGGAPL